VEKIISGAHTIHSLHKYMRKFRAEGIEEMERRISIFSFFRIISFVNFFSFKWSNRWLESLREWTSIFKEEYEIPSCLMTFVL
jgi:ABC-type transport system involved in cytochrome c biogenesis permease subunit